MQALREDDGGLIVPPQVPDRMHAQPRVVGHVPEALLLDHLPDLFRVDGPGHHQPRVALVDVVVFVRVLPLHLLAVALQHLGEPRVVPVRHLLNPRVFRRVRDKALVGFVRVQIRVEIHPNFRLWRANGEDQRVPRALADVLRLLHHRDVNRLVGFELGRVHGPETGEDELATVPTLDRVVGHGVPVLKPEQFDLIHEQAVNGFTDGLHHLPGAQDKQGIAQSKQQ